MSTETARPAPVFLPRRTPRLVLCTPTPEDVDELLTFRAAPAVTRWLLSSTVDPRAYREGWLEAPDETEGHYAVVRLHDTAIGTIGLSLTGAMAQPTGRLAGREGKVSYLLNPEQAGNGYATEALTSMLELAFDQLGLHRVTAGCFADNTASWRVMEKVGMRREQHGVKDSWHEELGWLDGFTYAILREEWLERTQ